MDMEETFSSRQPSSQAAPERERSVATWEQMEAQLPALRERLAPTMTWFEGASELDHRVVRNIETSKTYNVRSLFKYLTALNCRLQIDGEDVFSIEQAGEALCQRRRQQGHSLATMARESGLTVKAILNIEKGRGYTRRNLMRYIAALGNVVFAVREIIF